MASAEILMKWDLGCPLVGVLEAKLFGHGLGLEDKKRVNGYTIIRRGSSARYPNVSNLGLK